MIKSVMREHHWKPSEIGRLFLDNIDYRGIVWIYEDIVFVNEELEKKTPTL